MTVLLGGHVYVMEIKVAAEGGGTLIRPCGR